jgi:hypothetical protein
MASLRAASAAIGLARRCYGVDDALSGAKPPCEKCGLGSHPCIASRTGFSSCAARIRLRLTRIHAPAAFARPCAAQHAVMCLRM